MILLKFASTYRHIILINLLTKTSALNIHVPDACTIQLSINR